MDVGDRLNCLLLECERVKLNDGFLTVTRSYSRPCFPTLIFNALNMCVCVCWCMVLVCVYIYIYSEYKT